MLKIAINGFGRIGRNAFKAGFGKKGIKFVAINDLTDTKTLAYLLQHDTVYDEYEYEVGFDKTHLKVDGKKIKVLAEKDPVNLPWKKLDIDVVLECTGVFTSYEGASHHLEAGTKKVVVSAPVKDKRIPTYLLGVNADKYKGENLVDNGSCSTNCVAPIAKIMMKNFGIKKAAMTTIHAYTATQRIQDAPAKDLRKGRAAFENIIPSTTGAAIATTITLPKLAGLFDGIAMRVPTPVVSLIDFTIVTKKKVTVDKVNQAFVKASHLKEYKNIVATSREELVSSDYIKNSYSATVDLNLTKVIDKDLVKILVWYDNEWGYSNRLIELAEYIMDITYV